MPMPPEERRAAIEAILFVSGEPVTVEDLAEVLSESTRDEIGSSLEEISRRFEIPGSGIFLEQAAGGYRFATRPQFDPFLRKVFSRQNEGRLSIAALETLAIIAYRQPITAPEISEIRGVNSSAVLRTLLERRMVRIAGRKNVVGSPFLYRTTKDFLVHFGLNAIQDLPQLEEFTEILGENVIEELAGDMGGEGRFASDRGSGGETFDVPGPSAEISIDEDRAARDAVETSEPLNESDLEQDSPDQESELIASGVDLTGASPVVDSPEPDDQEQEEPLEAMTSSDRQN